jgi:carbamoyl-phosphate synthase large subunit
MKIVINKQELEEHVVNLLKTIPGNKLLLDHYLDGAIEAEADAICDGENVHHRNYGAHRTLWCALWR